MLNASKFKTSEFGVKEGLLTKKAPTKTVGASIVPQIHCKKAQGSGFSYVKGRKNGKGGFVKTQTSNRIPLMISTSKEGANSLMAMGTAQA